MGLDQRAGYNNIDVYNQRKEDVSVYDWRKHSRLQEFMDKLWHEKNPDDEGDFNCKRLVLTEEDILKLKKLVEDDDLPFCHGGFFWGHQFQEEAMKENKETDLKFCEDALQWIKEGKEVWYDCWW